jgi:hypothetical protein
MLTPEQENDILAHAYLPEHVFGLITTVSGAEPFLMDDYFCCRKDDWVIVIGYPLEGDFDLSAFADFLDKIKNDFKPGFLSVLAPELPESAVEACQERDSDHYYTVGVDEPVLTDSTKRNLKKAGRNLSVECASEMGKPHQDLMQAFIQRVKPSARVEELFQKMPQYVGSDNNAFVLNAWDRDAKLAAFYVFDLAAGQFANYIIGCYSREHYVRGASDLLMAELIKTARENGKAYVHLGLGVNDGVRRFKEKWGGKPSRSYEMCELFF